MDEKTLMLYFSEVEGITDKNKVAEYILKLDDNGKKLLKTKILNWISKKKTAKHAKGAKINYLKSLKHICADDEEVVYFRSGGKADCGCKKKNGGEIEKASRGIVAKFKDDRRKFAPGGNISPEERKRIDAKAKAAREAEKNVGVGQGTNKSNRFTAQKYYKDKKTKMDYKNNPEEKTPPTINKGIHRNMDGAKITKNCNGAVAKFKMHRLGGSLNGIPFYLAGTNEGGISWSRIFRNMPQKPISGAEAYISDLMVNDKDFKKYNNKANAYSEATPNILNTVNSIINRLKASYYGNKAGLQGYFNEVDKYSRDLWNRGNYLNAVFGSPFVPVVNR